MQLSKLHIFSQAAKSPNNFRLSSRVIASKKAGITRLFLYANRVKVGACQMVQTFKPLGVLLEQRHRHGNKSHNNQRDNDFCSTHEAVIEGQMRFGLFVKIFCIHVAVSLARRSPTLSRIKLIKSTV
jgi:hypothetical protein